MAQLVRGPFNLKWGGSTLLGVSEVSLEYEQESNDYTTIDSRNISVDGAISASVEVTFLESDVSTLAAVLPQYYKGPGETLSSGETVAAESEDGVIDVVAASCDADPVYNDLDIIACGDNANVVRLKNARTKISSMELADNAVRTVTVAFVGEPVAGSASLQFFRQNDVTTVVS